MDAIALAGYLDDLNVRAFLAAICLGEGTKGPDGYRTLYGGGKFDSFADHPRQYITAGGYTSTAAGKYQILLKTWLGLVKQYGFDDFSPANQDLACIALIHGRGALDDVVSGRIEQAVAKCNKEWASLPGSPYGQPVVTMSKFLAEYQSNGGMLEPQPLADGPPLVQLGPEKPDDAPDASVNSQGELIVKEKPMAPFLLAALPAIFEAVPALIKTFGSGSEMSQRNAKAAEVLVNTAKVAVNAVNEQDLVEKLRDPANATAVRQAVEQRWFEIAEVGGGIQAARAANERFMAPDAKPFWHSPAWWVSVIFMVLVGMLLVDVFWVNPGNYDGNLRTQIVTAVLSLATMLGAYWFGTSNSSQRKTELMSNRT